AAAPHPAPTSGRNCAAPSRWSLRSFRRGPAGPPQARARSRPTDFWPAPGAAGSPAAAPSCARPWLACRERSPDPRSAFPTPDSTPLSTTLSPPRLTRTAHLLKGPQQAAHYPLGDHVVAPSGYPARRVLRHDPVDRGLVAPERAFTQVERALDRGLRCAASPQHRQ